MDSVLIVDDDQILQEVLGAFMTQRGSRQILHAPDGDVALELLQEHKAHIQLIFCDLNMPNKDGIEFLLMLNQMKSRVPIIIVSSAGDQIVRSANSLATAYGLNDVATLAKPVDYVKLAEVAEEIMQPELQIA